MLSINYNPDVLSCLANLSNDEVFTPPKLVGDILDMLPQELFTNKDIVVNTDGVEYKREKWGFLASNFLVSFFTVSSFFACFSDFIGSYFLATSDFIDSATYSGSAYLAFST